LCKKKLRPEKMARQITPGCRNNLVGEIDGKGGRSN